MRRRRCRSPCAMRSSSSRPIATSHYLLHPPPRLLDGPNSREVYSRAMRVLVCPDKFRGTLTARQAADAIARGWRRARPRDDLVLEPLADGGEGTLDALVPDADPSI